MEIVFPSYQSKLNYSILRYHDETIQVDNMMLTLGKSFVTVGGSVWRLRV